jgi:putative tricarboxylic transport membrane protein
VPFILILVYVGAFAEKNVFEDLGVVLAFGALGWVMAKLDWPRPPLLLGLVLGPLAENRLFLSTDNYGAAWLLRPGVLIIAAVMAIGLIVPVVNRRRRRPASPPAEAVGGARGWRLDGVLAFDLALVILFAAALWLSRRFDVRAGLFPWTITTTALVLAVVQTARDLTSRGPVSPMPDVPDGAPSTGSQGEIRRTAAICGWILGMYVAIWFLGFSLATLVATVLYLKTAHERWPISIGLSLAGFAFVYGLFEKGLSVPFPPGQLFVWLGYGG